MKNYAYKSFDHADVIKLTREREWYKEELFARFEIIDSWGTLNGVNIELQTNKSKYNESSSRTSTPGM